MPIWTVELSEDMDFSRVAIELVANSGTRRRSQPAPVSKLWSGRYEVTIPRSKPLCCDVQLNDVDT